VEKGVDVRVHGTKAGRSGASALAGDDGGWATEAAVEAAADVTVEAAVDVAARAPREAGVEAGFRAAGGGIPGGAGGAARSRRRARRVLTKLLTDRFSPAACCSTQRASSVSRETERTMWGRELMV
jgi:hypothetical protein